MPEPLATGAIELTVNDQDFESSLQSLAQSAEKHGGAIDRHLARKVMDPLIKARFHAERLKKSFQEVGRESLKAAYREQYGQHTGMVRYAWDQHRGKVGEAGSAIRSTVGAGIGIGTGLAFAAAGAAGATTMNTLTGSLKMLALEAGGKTQNAVMALSKKIQQLAKTAADAPEGAIGATAGAVTGGTLGFMLLRFLGGPAALLGAGLGAAGGLVAGYKAETGANKDARIDAMARQFVTGGADLAQKAHLYVGKYFKDPKKDISKSGFVEELQLAMKKSEDPNFRARKDEFLTAGLNMQPQFTDLADLRRQAQLAVFNPDGPLGQANLMKELENNLKAINGENVKVLEAIEKNTRPDNKVKAGHQAPP